MTNDDITTKGLLLLRRPRGKRCGRRVAHGEFRTKVSGANVKQGWKELAYEVEDGVLETKRTRQK